jgi:hypothetical protein
MWVIVLLFLDDWLVINALFLDINAILRTVQRFNAGRGQTDNTACTENLIS